MVYGQEGKGAFVAAGGVVVDALLVGGCWWDFVPAVVVTSRAAHRNVDGGVG